MRWIFISLVCISTFSYIYASEALIVGHAPPYMKFEANNQAIKSSEVPEVVSAALGFTTTKDVEWSGLKAGNPLKKPQAFVGFELDGFFNITLKLNKITYPLQSDLYLGQSYELLDARICKRFEDVFLTSMEIINADSMDDTKVKYEDLLRGVSTRPSELLADLPSKFLAGRTLTSLNTEFIVDNTFLMDMELFNEVLSALLKNGAPGLREDGMPDLFWFRSAALRAVINEYGSDSPQVAEAVELLKITLKEVEKIFSGIYDDNYLYFVLTVDVESSDHRARRSLLQLATVSPTVEYPSGDMNLSQEYDEDYPAIFNIIFFVMLIISLSVFAIALGMWHIDPGRDSIIYRMTSQRIKKDQ